MIEMADLGLLSIGAWIFVGSYVAYYIYAGLTGPLAKLPGPWWSKFTSLPIAYQVFHGTRIYLLHDLHKKYGPIIRATPSEVSVADPKAAYEIHKFRSEYLKTQFYEDFAPDGAQNIFTTADPAHHARWRKLFASSVSQSNLFTLQPLIRRYVTVLVRRMERERREQGYVDVVKWLRAFTSDITGEMSVGSSLGTMETGEETQYVSDINRMFALNILRLAVWQTDFSTTRNLPFFPFSALRGVSERLNTVVKAYMDDYRARISSGDSDGDNGSGGGQTRILLDKALAVQAQEGIPESEVLSNAVLLMIAGTDTTANTVAYMVWLVLKYPEIRERLVREIEDAGIPEDPSISDFGKLKYLDHFIMETLRLYGPAPGPLPRKVPEGGRDLGGHFIPGGTTVSPLSYSVSRNPDIYPDPYTFNPDRWADATPTMKDADFSWGGGARICLGMHIAQLEMRMVMVALLRSPLLGSDAKLAYGVNGFSDDGMVQFESMSARPRGNQVLIH
ncbi:cytochrome P450 [Microdochium bolleyi]|uniref:Cytochrome P450 n=1 Tax=Microdochium bolleyi TaxID=196109 RepID=A0A136JDF2_9PEZI|nr:cytochrome P450 [Microdochium bolleyi]